jgi:type VI secretion system protein ImpC
MLVGDYEFGRGADDIALLKRLSNVAASAHAPFVAAASPKMMNFDRWDELGRPRDLAKIFESVEFAAWKSFRESEDSRYVALTLPRVLSRLPYGQNFRKVDEFNYEESVDGSDHDKYSWMSASWAYAARITDAFAKYGWMIRSRGVEGGGKVEGLPVHTFPTDDGDVAMKCPTEIAISDRREAELAKAGFMPLIHRKNSDSAYFIGAQSLQKPQEYDDADATANANLAARLPYMFACCRFAHYLKCIVRDKVGGFATQASMQAYLKRWITQYVDGDPENSSEDVKARKPLAEAEVVVEEIEGNPGYYSSKFFLKPHYQLEGLTVSLRLVSKLPSQKK